MLFHEVGHRRVAQRVFVIVIVFFFVFVIVLVEIRAKQGYSFMKWVTEELRNVSQSRHRQGFNNQRLCIRKLCSY